MQEDTRAARRRRRSRRESVTQALKDWQNVVEASRSVLETQDFSCHGRAGSAAPIDDEHIAQQQLPTSEEALTDTFGKTIKTTQNSKYLEAIEENYALLNITSDKLESIDTNMAQQTPSDVRLLMPNPENFLPTSFDTHQYERLWKPKTESPLHEDIVDPVPDQPQNYTMIHSMATKDINSKPRVAKHNNSQEEISVHATEKEKNPKVHLDHYSQGKDKREITGRSHAACLRVDDEIEDASASSALSDEPEECDDATDNVVNDKSVLESALSTIKSLLLENLLDCTQLEATDATEDSPSSSRSFSTGNGSNMSLPQSSKGLSNNNTTKRPRGRGRNDPGDGDGDDDSSSEDDDDSRRPQKKHVFDRMPQRRLRCPFYQREPDKHTKAACRGEGFTEMGKLKDHLKRVHTQPLRCPRCE